jgi:hypothetical protein
MLHNYDPNPNTRTDDCSDANTNDIAATVNPNILHSRHINIMHFNIRGLLSNLQHLKELINTLKSKNLQPDAIMLCETLLSDTKQTICHINGFKLFTNNRDSRGGCLAILLCNDFDYNRLKEKEIDSTKEFESFVNHAPKQQQANHHARRNLQSPTKQ